MKKTGIRVLALAVLLAVSATTCTSTLEQNTARTRVDLVLKGLKIDGTGLGNDAQTSICMWYVGKYIVSQDDLGIASNGFTDWTKEKEMYRKISGYTVDSATNAPAGSGVIVAVTIEGKPYKIRAIDKKPLTWEP